MQPPILPSKSEVQRIVEMALAEDIGAGDITSRLIIPPEQRATMCMVARESMVISGLFVAQSVFKTVDASLQVEILASEGAVVSQGAVLATIAGAATSILAAERVALNLVQRMCGIATLTSHYVQAVQGTQAIVLDTRKTMPGLRVLDKYAVRCGGGQNHRMRLDDAVLIKDNHIAVAGSVAAALSRVQAGNLRGLSVEVECDTLAQVGEALAAGAGRLLLDNMNPADLRAAVALARGKAKTEASGNVSLDTIREIALTGVDYISVGRLTHSVCNVDIGLDAA